MLVLVILAAGVLPVGYSLIGPLIDRHHVRHNDRDFLDRYCAGGGLVRYHQMNRRLPAQPRCKLCYIPFGGVGRVLGIRPSRKNSNFCRSCFEAAPLGGHETPIGVLFADARGFTEWATHEAATDVAAALNRFYKGAMSTLMAHDAIVDKFLGDEVMALFISDIPTLGAKTCDQMLIAAEEMMAAAKQSFSELPIGVGLHYGAAWVGNVGVETMKDFTALGDVVNIAARLQGCAGPGQIVMSEDVYARLTAPPITTEQRFTVKGKTDPLHARVSTPGGGSSPGS